MNAILSTLHLVHEFVLFSQYKQTNSTLFSCLYHSSVGSLGQNMQIYETVEQVYVGYSTLPGTTNGVRIKTWQVRKHISTHTWTNVLSSTYFEILETLIF